MKQGSKDIGMNVGEAKVEKIAIEQDVKKMGHGVGNALYLISSLSDQDGSEDMGCVEDDDDKDEKKKKMKRGKGISRGR